MTRQRSLISNRSFAGLAGAQFLEAANDNLFKTVVSLFAVGALADENGGAYLSLTGIAIAVPYLLFSGYGGQLADAVSKRSVMMGCKLAEIAIALGAVVALAHADRINSLMAILFLLASHSAFFSPSKYGSVPEIAAPDQLVRANGILKSSRYAAIILGSIVGGVLMQMWRTTPVRIGWAMVAIAGLGFVSQHAGETGGADETGCLCGHQSMLDSHPGCETNFPLEATGPRGREPHVFDILAALTMMDVLLLARVELGMGDAAAGTLGAFAAVGTLIGALLCAYLPEKHAGSEIAPVAGLGIAVTLCAAAASAHGYWSLGGLLLMLGVFAGLFVVPFIASLQKAAGGGEKGLIISTANFIDMAGVLFASALLAFLHEVVQLGPRTILVIAAAAAAAYMAGLLVWQKRPQSRTLPSSISNTQHEVNHARA